MTFGEDEFDKIWGVDPDDDDRRVDNEDTEEFDSEITRQLHIEHELGSDSDILTAYDKDRDYD